jgi:DNA-binding NarL/FixJ family response regulator
LRILLVEDDKLHLNYLKEQVTSAFDSIQQLFCASTGAEAEALARSEDLTAIVMDLRMKERNGVDAARVIWRERPHTRILFWSNYADEAYLRGISRIVPEQSAYGYVLKTATPERLALAMRAVLAEGQILIDREVHSLNSFGKRRKDALNEVELAILNDIALGLPDKFVALRHGLSLRTVQNRLMNLYDKLSQQDNLFERLGTEPNKRNRAVATAVKQGFITSETLETTEKELAAWAAQKTIAKS